MLFTLLHTNDCHNGLKSGQAELLRHLRLAIDGRGLLLDAGDAVASGNITFHFAGEPILDAMSDIGYDAMTVGNREFHFTRRGFQCKLSQARFPILCANLRSTRWSSDSTFDCFSTKELPTVPYIIRAMNNGFRIAVMGLTVPMITQNMMVRRAASYLFDDPIETAARLAPEIRAACRPDILIALTHIGIQQDRKLAAAVPEIDMIIGGHSHDVLEHGERVGDTLIVQAGSHSHFVGRVDIHLTNPIKKPIHSVMNILSEASLPDTPGLKKYDFVPSLIPLPANPAEADIDALIRLMEGPITL